METMTKEEALAFFESGAWREMSDRERAEFQLFQDRLCMPFDEFHGAVERTLGRPVFSHELGLNREGLQAELLDGADPPTLADIVEQLASRTNGQVALVVVDDDAATA